jgi:hypothetical protein
MSLKLSDSEKARFSKWVNSLEKENTQKCKTIIIQAVLNTERWAKSFVPVDKGFLKSSIQKVIGYNGLGGSVFTQRLYAPYVEFGTGRKVFSEMGEYYEPNSDLKSYAAQFKGRGIRKINREARPYLFPAWRMAQRDMMEKLKAMGFEPVE